MRKSISVLLILTFLFTNNVYGLRPMLEFSPRSSRNIIVRKVIEWLENKEQRQLGRLDRKIADVEKKLSAAKLDLEVLENMRDRIAHKEKKNLKEHLGGEWAMLHYDGKIESVRETIHELEGRKGRLEQKKAKLISAGKAQDSASRYIASGRGLSQSGDRTYASSL